MHNTAFLLCEATLQVCLCSDLLIWAHRISWTQMKQTQKKNCFNFVHVVSLQKSGWTQVYLLLRSYILLTDNRLWLHGSFVTNLQLESLYTTTKGRYSMHCWIVVYICFSLSLLHNMPHLVQSLPTRTPHAHRCCFIMILTK